MPRPRLSSNPRWKSADRSRKMNLSQNEPVDFPPLAQGASTQSCNPTPAMPDAPLQTCKPTPATPEAPLQTCKPTPATPEDPLQTCKPISTTPETGLWEETGQNRVILSQIQPAERQKHHPAPVRRRKPPAPPPPPPHRSDLRKCARILLSIPPVGPLIYQRF